MMTSPDGSLRCKKIHGLVRSGLAPLFLDVSEWASLFLHGPSHPQSRRMPPTIVVPTPVQNKAGVEQAGGE